MYFSLFFFFFLFSSSSDFSFTSPVLSPYSYFSYFSSLSHPFIITLFFLNRTCLIMRHASPQTNNAIFTECFQMKYFWNRGEISLYLWLLRSDYYDRILKFFMHIYQETMPMLPIYFILFFYFLQYFFSSSSTFFSFFIIFSFIIIIIIIIIIIYFFFFVFFFFFFFLFSFCIFLSSSSRFTSVLSHSYILTFPPYLPLF